MALSPSLQQFKSSGVYRLEFDKSQITNIPSETIRLIIGFSKKGPFNTPVFVQDNVFFTTVFGDIDTTLERKGSFFHRTVLTALDRGPVIVLNLLKLDDTLDQSEFRSISTAAYQDNSPDVFTAVSDFFNQDKFWFADATSLVDTANNGTSQSVLKQRLLNIANVGRKTVSILTKKSDILGFDVLAKDWFGVGKVPAYLRDNDYISDYLVDVVIVEGDFSNYSLLSIDPIFGPYFDTTGLKKSFTDEYGFVRDGLTTFLNLDQVNVLGVYSGSLLPEFQDKNGNNVNVQDLVNLETSKTGVLLGINTDTFDDSAATMSGDTIDLVGHTLESESPAALDYLSYYGGITDIISYPEVFSTPIAIIAGATSGVTANALLTASTSLQGATGWVGAGATGYYDTLTIYGPSATLPSGYTAYATGATWTALQSEINTSSFVGTEYLQGPSGLASTVDHSKVISRAYNSALDTIVIQIGLTAGTGVTGPTDITSDGFYYIDALGATSAGGTASISIIKSLDFTINDAAGATPGAALYSGINSTLYGNNLSGLITDGDAINVAAGATASYAFADFDRLSTNDIGGATGITGNSVFGAESPILNQVVNYLRLTPWVNSDFTGVTTIDTSITDYQIRTYTGDINESFELNGSYTNPVTVVTVDNSASGPLGLNGFNGEILKGQYFVMNHGGTGTATKIDPITGKSRLTRIISVSEDVNPLSATYKKITITTNDPIFISTDDNEVERYKVITDFITHYKFSTLDGYTLRTAQMPNGNTARENEILDVMYNSNIAQALTDREVISFRYIVDTFQGGIEPASKIRLSRLAKNRQSALAICNMPSVKQFKNSTNPLFKYNTTSSFSTQYVPTGGNLTLNPSNLFNLPGIADGANYAAYYGPNLIIRENGSNVSVPPAAAVSNLFIDKYNLALPYSIVAGPRRGVVTGQGLVGVEYAFDRQDLDYIEPFGYNAIVNKRGFGLTINANQTAQQTVKSALSQVHVRELLIYIQDGIEAILKNYRWEFNTAQNRLEIKTLSDNFLSQVLSDGGVYDFQNIMDSTNNTSEVIDNNIGILDTYIEPVRGMGILVHRTTILKTGTIATGNFI